MINVSKNIKLSVAVLLIGFMIPVFAGDAEKGKKIALTKSIGNCLACHAMANAEQPGSMGPALEGMKTRYPNKEDIKARIWDNTRYNPISSMPPFGRNAILTEEQIDDVTEYIYSL